MDEETLQTSVKLLEEFAWEDNAYESREPLPALTPEELRFVLARLRSDETLVLLIQRDILRNEAYEELFVQRYHPLLLRWFWHWCKDRERSSDFTQDMLCRFFENRLESFDPSRNFRAYLYKVAQNLFLDDVRRKKQHKMQSLDSISEIQAPDQNPIDPDFDERVECALQKLPPLEQRVLRETIADRSADEIARGLEVSRKRVYALLYQARRQVERELHIPSMTRLYQKNPSE